MLNPHCLVNSVYFVFFPFGNLNCLSEVDIFFSMWIGFKTSRFVAIMMRPPLKGFWRWFERGRPLQANLGTTAWLRRSNFFYLEPNVGDQFSTTKLIIVKRYLQREESTCLKWRRVCVYKQDVTGLSCIAEGILVNAQRITGKLQSSAERRGADYSDSIFTLPS